MTLKPYLLADIVNPVINDSDKISANSEAYVNNVIQTIFSIFMIVGVIYFIWYIVMAGYHIISSEGDPKKWEEAKQSLVHALVGILIVFSLFAILKFVGTVTGVSELQNLKLSWPSL